MLSASLNKAFPSFLPLRDLFICTIPHKKQYITWPLLYRSHSKVFNRRDHIIRLEPCMVSPPPPPPPPSPWGDVGDFGPANRVSFNGYRGSVTLMFGDRRKRKRGKKLCAPGAVKWGGGPKPAAQLPAAVPSYSPHPAQLGASKEVQGDQSRCLNRRGRSRLATGSQLEQPKSAGKGATTASAPALAAPRLPSTGRSSLPPTAVHERYRLATIITNKIKTPRN